MHLPKIVVCLGLTGHITNTQQRSFVSLLSIKAAKSTLKCYPEPDCQRLVASKTIYQTQVLLKAGLL